MTAPDELERAAGNLAVLARDLERYDPWSGTRSKSDASDLRLLLSERAELLAAVEKMRGLLEKTTDLLASASRSTDRPSDYVLRVVMEARAALTTGEANHKDKP